MYKHVISLPHDYHSLKTKQNYNSEQLPLWCNTTLKLFLVTYLHAKQIKIAITSLNVILKC